MPRSRRNRSSHTNPSSVVQEGRLGQRRNKGDEQWDSRFNEVVQYKAKHGDCNVTFSQANLGKWVSRQRAAYNANSLAQDRIDRLSSIGFKWAMKEAVQAVPWETRFNELVQYKTKSGHCNVPKSQGKLGTWASKQRIAYKANSLVQDRIDRLNNIGFKWAMTGPAVPWETRFNQLVQYKTKSGHCNVPQSQGQLGTWVRTQRKACKDNSLAQDRIDQLNGIGFKWAFGATKGGSGPTVPCKTIVDGASVKNGDCASGPALPLPDEPIQYVI